MTLEIREATPSDAPAIRALVSQVVDVDRLVMDRRVIVAESEEEVTAAAAYDTWNGTVHLSTLVGDPEAFEALLEEPLRFAEREGCPVEIVVPADDTRLEGAVRRVGFEPVGPGPTVDGADSTKYRFQR